MARIALRESDPERDAAPLCALIDRYLATLAQWLTSVVKLRSAEDARSFLQAQRDGNARGGVAHRLIVVDGEMAGARWLHGISQAHRYARLGYWLADPCAGRGIMHAALTQVIGYAFADLRLHRLELGCAPGSARSCAVAERLGFRREGELREAQCLNGRFWNLRCYGLLAEEWKHRA